MLFKIFGANWRTRLSGIIAVIANIIYLNPKLTSFLPNELKNYSLEILQFIILISGIIFVFTVKDSNVTGGKIAQTEEAKKRIRKEIDDQKKYSTKIETPIYEPKNKKPEIVELVDTTKSNQLIKEIIDSDIPNDEKNFLIDAAKRHSIFNYEKIADYYAHSSKKVQDLMEKSALVIIDFGKAIEYGYVKLCDEIRNRYLEHRR
jgi:hypothetical protein